MSESNSPSCMNGLYSEKFLRRAVRFRKVHVKPPLNLSSWPNVRLRIVALGGQPGSRKTFQTTTYASVYCIHICSIFIFIYHLYSIIDLSIYQKPDFLRIPKPSGFNW